MTLIVKLFSPITIMVQMAVSFFLRVLGLKIRPEESKEAYDMEALRGAIDLSHHEGKMVKRDRDMLGGVLDLSHREVSEIMTHRRTMETVDASAAPEAIVKQVIESNHTRIPIWRDNPDNIIGVLHAQALLKAVQSSDKAAVTINEILSVASEPWFVPETTTLIDQLAAFRRRRNHVALVVDEYGDLMGLVTLEDILEEIVGQIYDETDKLIQGIKSLPDGSYRVKGSVTIRDLNRRLGWHLPDENAATVAGLVMYEAQSVPDEGQTFMFYGCEFTILKRKMNQIVSVQVRMLPKQEI
jgi:Mg2+/Co2+ transporter CorB